MNILTVDEMMDVYYRAVYDCTTYQTKNFAKDLIDVITQAVEGDIELDEEPSATRFNIEGIVFKDVNVVTRYSVDIVTDKAEGLAELEKRRIKDGLEFHCIIIYSMELVNGVITHGREITVLKPCDTSIL